MGKTKKLKSGFATDDSGSGKDQYTLKKGKPFIESSSDGEANEDLSLKIIEKALAKRKNGVVLETKVEPLDCVVASDSGDGLNLKSKKKKKKREKIECAMKEEENLELDIDSEGKTESVKPDTADTPENLVLKKLLRGPRYFDPPDSSWGTCYNCGEEGHMAVNCNLAKRKKPCFVCGSLDHSRRLCPKGQDCYICNKGGHHAKDCPEKNKANIQSSKACLRCGESGHDMFTCRNVYTSDDLKEIQCYICKTFGHLSCAKVVETSTGDISCYKCGQVGHTGLACNRLRVESNGDASPGSCYKCGEEGHFARECTSSYRSHSRFYGESSEAGTLTSCYRCGGEGHFARECMRSATPINKTHRNSYGAASPSSCYKCGGEGHFARECVSSARVNSWNEVSTPTLKSHRQERVIKSAPKDYGKSHKRKRGHEDESFATPKKFKRRGGWIMDDPEDLNDWKPYKSNWKSPSTPKSKGHKKFTFASSGHRSSSRSYDCGSSMQGGSSMSSQSYYYASRFSNSNGGRRNHDWW